MPQFLQIEPVTGPDAAVPYALLALEDGGRVWYGKLVYDGKTTDGGPTAVAWRMIQGRY